MLSGRFRQASTDKIRRIISLERDLASGEQITGIDPYIDGEETLSSDGLTLENVTVLLPGAISYQFYVGGGEPGSIYELKFVASTTQGQSFTDYVQIMVEGYQ